MLRVIPIRILHRPGCRWYQISTLNPSRLLPSDCIPFKSINSAKLADVYDPTNSNKGLFFPQGSIQHIQDPSPYGFLYLHQPNDAPSTVSELRFRVVNEPYESIASKIPYELFLNGTDLLLRNDVFYSLPLYKIVKKASLGPIKEFLLRDGIVSEELVERVDRIFPNLFPESVYSLLSPSTVIYKLNQPFPVHVLHSKATVFLVSEDKVVDLNIGMSWLGYPEKRQKMCRGTASIIIERASSSSPNGEPTPSSHTNEASSSGFFSTSSTTTADLTDTSNPKSSSRGTISTPYFNPSLSTTPNAPTPHSHPNDIHPYLLRVVRPPRAAPKLWFEKKWRKIRREIRAKHNEQEREREKEPAETETSSTKGEELGVAQANSTSTPSLSPSSPSRSFSPSTPSQHDVDLDSNSTSQNSDFQSAATSESSQSSAQVSSQSSSESSSEPGLPSESSSPSSESTKEGQRREKQEKFYTPYIQPGRSTQLRAFSYMMRDQGKLKEVVKDILR